MNAVRKIAKINLLLSVAVYLSWLGYRLCRGLPIIEANAARSLHPAWLWRSVEEGFYIYVFIFDKRISELIVRGVGIICAFGLVLGAVIVLLRNQIYGSPWFPVDPLRAWYAWPSVVACAMVGRRPLSEAEAERLSRIVARSLGRGR